MITQGNAIAASYVSILQKTLDQCGVSHFLERIHFDSKRLSDPNAFLSFTEFNHIIKLAYEFSACPYLGLIFGEQLSISNHGFLGYAALTSPTLRAAIQITLDFLNIRTGLLHAFLLEKEVGKACVTLNVLTEPEYSVRFVTEAAIIHLVKMHQFLMGEQSVCGQIDVSFLEPSYGSHYHALLNTPLLFGQAQTRVWFPQADLDKPLSFGDMVSHQQAKMQLQHLAQYLNPKDLPSKIKNIILEEKNFAPLMETIAQRLHVSERTLRRHLQAHGLNFQSLVEEVREQKAKELLALPNINITEISYTLGFHDLANFTKAFKRWTGMPPSEYRRKLSE